MKKLFLILIFILSQIIFVSANINIVFVDLNKIMSQSKIGSSILNQLNQINSKNLKSFQDQKKKLKEQETVLISQKNILSKNDFEIKVKKLKMEVKIYNENRDEIINSFNKLKIDNTNKLLKMINVLLVKYSEEKSISLILNKKDLVIGKKELDITSEIIKIVNNNLTEFKVK